MGAVGRSAVALGGAFCTFIMIVSTCAGWVFVPR